MISAAATRKARMSFSQTGPQGWIGTRNFLGHALPNLAIAAFFCGGSATVPRKAAFAQDFGKFLGVGVVSLIAYILLS